MEIKKKQEFLVDQIINKGYDANTFAQYIQDQREEGDDLQNWSLSSLQEAVLKYKQITDVEPHLEGLNKMMSDGKLSDENQGNETSNLNEKVENYEAAIHNLEEEISHCQDNTQEGKKRSFSLQKKIENVIDLAKDDAAKLAVGP